MKNIVLIVTIFVLTLCEAHAQTPSNDDLYFPVTTLDLGTIKEEEGRRSVSFRFENRGETPVVINGVSTSCGCTTSSYDKEPIMPGAVSDIKVVYDPASRPGFFDKKILVLTDNRRRQNVLTIQGKVIARPLTITDKYPYMLGNGILASSSSIEYGQIPIGYKHTLSVDIYNTSNEQVKLTVPKSAVDSEISYYIANPILKAKQSTQLIITIDITSSVICKLFKVDIPIAVNGVVAEDSHIEINGVSIPDVTTLKADKDSPEIFLPEIYHYFSTVYQSEKHLKEFRIENEGRSELVIKQIIITDSEAIKFSISTTKIAPMQSAILRVQFNANKMEGRFNGDIILISNDPSFPLSEIRIAANVKKLINEK